MPDLLVSQFTIQPAVVLPGVPVTFTVVVANPGTAVADNLALPGSGTRLDVFIAPVPSYPWVRFSEKGMNGTVPALAAGEVYTAVLTYGGFSEQELNQIGSF